MIPLDDAQTRELHKTRLIAVAMLIVAPVIYLAIAFFWLQTGEPIAAEADLAFYIMIIVAALSPLFLPIIEKTQRRNFQQQSNSTMSASQMFTITTLTKLAFVESSHIMGLVIFLVSGDLWRMLVFYAIGICWSFVHWPSEENFRRFLQKSEVT